MSLLAVIPHPVQVWLYPRSPRTHRLPRRLAAAQWFSLDDGTSNLAVFRTGSEQFVAVGSVADVSSFSTSTFADSV